MTTKKEILDWTKSIAEHQDLIATIQNTERKAEANALRDMVDGVLMRLDRIYDLLYEVMKKDQTKNQ